MTYVCNVCSPTVPHNQVEDYTQLVEEIYLHSQLISIISNTTVLVPIRTAIYFLASFLVDRLHNQENGSDHKCSKPSAWEFPTEGLDNRNRKKPTIFCLPSQQSVIQQFTDLEFEFKPSLNWSSLA